MKCRNHKLTWKTLIWLIGLVLILLGTGFYQEGNTALGAEIPISQAPSHQAFPAAASDGNNTLFVWQDLRNDPGCADPFSTLDCNWDIYGARVSATGQILEPNGIPIATASNAQVVPAVTFGGGYYLVVWQSTKGVVPEGSDNANIYAARVTPNGQVLDPNGIYLGSGWHDCSFGVAFDGNNFLVTWAHSVFPSQGYVFATRVTVNGTVLPVGGFQVSKNEGAWSTAGYGGGVYFVTWDNFGALVSPSGVVLNSEDIPINAGLIDSSYSVSFDGTNFLVTTHGGGGGLVGSFIDTGGNILSQPTISNISGIPSVAFDGDRYRVVWPSNGTIYSTQVFPTGQVENPGGVQLVAGNVGSINSHEPPLHKCYRPRYINVIVYI